MPRTSRQYHQEAPTAFAASLLAALLIQWSLLALAPVDRQTWVLENVLLALPAAQMLRHAGVPERLCPRLAVLLLMACSSLYELIEWAAALVFGGDLGVHYLGTQGDLWDSQRDMALAALGAVLAMLGLMIRGSRATRLLAHTPEQSRRAACGNSSSALGTGVPRRAAACRRTRRVGYRT